MLLCPFPRSSWCAAERLNLSASRRSWLRCAERQLPLMGFKDPPLHRTSAWLAPVRGVSTASLRRVAAMRLALPLSSFLRPQRLLPSIRLSDVSIARADRGVRVVLSSPASRQLWTLQHASPFEVFPSPPAASILTPSSACTVSGFTADCSPLVVGPLPPPLRIAALRGCASATSGSCSGGESVAPSPKR